MRFEIEIEKIVSKVDTYVIDVEDEGEGNMIVNRIEEDIEEANNPDEIMDAFREAGVKVIEIEEGVENLKYEAF